jgi:hypothetical protein
VATEPIELRGPEEPIERNVLLDVIDPSITFVPDAVRVRVTLEESLTEREVDEGADQGARGATVTPGDGRPHRARAPSGSCHNLTLPAGRGEGDARRRHARQARTRSRSR